MMWLLIAQAVTLAVWWPIFTVGKRGDGVHNAGPPRAAAPALRKCVQGHIAQTPKKIEIEEE